jgi:hypothetical protein
MVWGLGAMMWCFPWCLLLSWVLSKGQCSIWRSLEHLRLVRFEIPHGFARAPTEPLLKLVSVCKGFVLVLKG